MKTMLYIKADTNDADFVTYFREITEKEVAELKPILEIIKRHRKYPQYPHLGKVCKWNTREMDDETVEEEYKGELTELQIEIMNEYVPYGEYGVHSIHEIKLIYVEKEEDLLK